MNSAAVVDHYGQNSPIERIKSELAANGIDLAHLTIADLAGVDEFHLGGKKATLAMLKGFDATAELQVLDVGSGIGGVARTIASETRSIVTGIDLTPGFVTAATELSRLVSLDAITGFEIGDALDLRFDDGHFDAITLVHVGMNIGDKPALFAELARVLRPSGSLHVYDIMRVGEGELPYPMPWSTEPSTSFVATAADYASAIQAAGLETSPPTNRLGLVQEALGSAQTNPPAVNLSHLMGENWPTMIGNLASALSDGLLAPIEFVARP